MLTLRPQAPPSRPPDHTMYQRRGRSRQVSHTALARQASEERQATVGGLQGRLYLRAMNAEPTRPIQVERRPPSPEDEPELVPAGPVAVSSQSVYPAPNKPTFLPLPSLSPPSASLTPDYYDSPPSPPRSLVDQVHVAYALDDIHLAKVLLLKLKGIEVTSDDDPRIAAVQDEDFDFCFVPHGKLMDEADEKALLEQQRKEMEKLEEKRRAERLRACERIWEQEKRRLREAKAVASRRREAEEKKKAEEDRRRAEETALMRIAKEEEVAERRVRMSRPLVAPPPRNVVSYDILGKSRTGSSHATPSSSSSVMAVGLSVSSRVEEPFVYDFMVAPRRTTPRSRPLSESLSSKSLSSQSLSHLNVQTVARSTYDESRSIPFADVLASMQGPLFPVERRNATSSDSKSKSSTRRTSELLDCLLKVVEWGEGERKQRKGKAVDRPSIQRRGSDKSVLQSPCAACSSPTSPASTSSSWLSSPTSSRRPWLSFGSTSTSSSASTSITTPSTSPIPGWLSKPLSTSPLPLPVPTSRPRPMSLLLPPISLAQPEPHSCKPCAYLTPIPIEEAPLGTGKQALNLLPSGMSWSQPPGSHRKERSTTPPGGQVMRRVSQFVKLAKGFQNAYMNATLFSVSASSDSFEDRDIHAAFVVSVSEGWHLHNRGPHPTPQRLKPPGSRVSSADVSIFLNSPSRSHILEPSSQFVPAPPIPLRPRSNPSTDPPRTILPNPLPYPIIFKPLPVPCRSPFRLHAHIHSTHHMPTNGYNPTPAPWVSDRGSGAGGYGSTVTWRVRTVENPVFLRLKALHNIMWDRGTNWQGRAQEGSLGSGKEKIIQIAFEGVGRSWLGVDDWQEPSYWQREY